MSADDCHPIETLVDRETTAWNERDVEALLDLFHPDMVWAWPPTADDHDPVHWVMPLGRFDRARWGQQWADLFATHDLLHNRRTTVAIQVSDQGDGGFAVVDVDTAWRNRETGEEQHWFGRATKFYVKVGPDWKMISHGGLLTYEPETHP